MDGMITREGEGTAAMEGNIYMRGYGRDDLQGRGKEQQLWKVIYI